MRRLPAVAFKLEHGARACMDGVPRAHIIDSHHPEAILAEVFDNIGIGVMIHADEYRSRPPGGGTRHRQHHGAAPPVDRR
ncbi:MAG: hypothetical protein R3F11_15715 [Verrucomicrobiales bacterium]